MAVNTSIVATLMLFILISGSETMWNIFGLFILLICTYFTWASTNKGLHPSFLFQLFLIFFQGGRLISYVLNGGKFPIWLIDLYASPTALSISTIRTTIFLLSICSYIIYLTTLIRLPVLKVRVPAISSNIFLIIFLSTLPFYIYKNVSYLQYIFTHGGYIAIYANNGEHLQSVGLVIRFLSNISFSAYLLYIFSEDKLKRLKYLMIFFVILFASELIIGLRGKYFVFLLLNILVYKQKIKKGFNISYLAVISALVVIASIFIASFRENRELDSSSLLSAFFYTQGNSSIVSALAVEEYDRFHPFSFNYLFKPILLSFRHQNLFKPGDIFATDLTNYLSPMSFDLGFGTGTSFIAELYLLSGIPTIIIGTFLIGLLMSVLRNYLYGIAGTMSFIILMGCVYLPRSSYFEPVSGIIKYGIPCLFVYFLSIAAVLLINRKISFSY
ncbi:O-antigen polysaccharide polymerase Wzy [Segetibacter aerophilus]|uniref:O-antigen polysaccharide polymerase Wzy n=1 Tax=Segetibacter aerophilus TaxID=670293 RepID=UPI0011BD5C75|nr:O-antigen polysaccharide polymerase Wzy [Segetibacter aerophilus]